MSENDNRLRTSLLNKQLDSCAD